MPKSITETLEQFTPRRSPRFIHLKKNTSEQEQLTSLRKSSRIHNQKKGTQEPLDLKTPKPISNRVVSSRPSCSSSKAAIKKHVKDCSDKFSRKMKNRESPSPGLINSPIMSEGHDGSRSLRRSLRITNQRNVVALANENTLDKSMEKSTGSNPRARKSPKSKRCVKGVQSVGRSRRLCNRLSIIEEHNDRTCRTELLSSVRKRGVEVKSCEKVVVKSEKKQGRVFERSKPVDSGSRVTKVQDSDKGDRDREVGDCRKRKRDEVSRSQGWTNEQELALQRAYFISKPTPHFWKKVAKLVPGKSAQDCFDKVNSEYVTPHQPQPRSRAKIITDLSPLRQFSLSASKLLKPSKPKVKKQGGNKQKSHLGQKAVRQLLQRHCHLDQDPEADLFSVLEPNLDKSTDACQPGDELSTPKKLLKGKQRLFQRCNERSSSGHKKKSLSKLSSSFERALASPPVLKEVKNKFLHDKYIDQLHIRDAKRKKMSALIGKSTLITEDEKENHMLKFDVRVAKKALVSDVRDAINKIKHVRDDATSDLDADVIEGDQYEEDEDEDEI